MTTAERGWDLGVVLKLGYSREGGEAKWCCKGLRRMAARVMVSGVKTDGCDFLIGFCQEPLALSRASVLLGRGREGGKEEERRGGAAGKQGEQGSGEKGREALEWSQVPKVVYKYL